MTLDINNIEIFYRFGAALLIGLLVGLQREYAQLQLEKEEKSFGGARTFALLALLGCVAALISESLDSPLVFSVIAVIIGGLIMIAYSATAREGNIGMTSEVAAVITVLAGALCFWGELALAAALGVATTVLLELKLQTRTLARNITHSDVYATLSFAVITLVILPVLPSHSFGPPPFDVLVPYNIWLMVVFISGISFLGYLLIKIIGARRGVGITGLLGGLASSTAVTLSFAQRSRTIKGLERPFAMAILLAWGVMFVRVMIEVAVINPVLFRVVWVPLTAALAVSATYCIYLYRSQATEKQEEEDKFKNPFELGPALTFGLVYALILLAANTAKMYFGNTGLYVSSIVSGLADVDAITLSLAELSRDTGELDLNTASRGIVMAAVSNTLVKSGIVLAMGSRELRKVITPGLLAIVGTAIAVVFML
ncbi:MAG: MgtC/SapB family protein [Thiotrichales bacterium]|nr:MAG: MgtC/SapB family protein [Thiotrichales bacterium]